MLEQKRQQKIEGYEHPTKITTNRSKVYKTFTEGKKAKKNEKFGNVYVDNQYSTITSPEEEEVCPVCEAEVVYSCPCGYSDKKCSNNHIWYTDRDGVVKKGNPH